MIHRAGKGDQLAAGAASAVFTGPKLKFNEGEMRDDLSKLPSEAFIMKYMITQREYDMLQNATDEKLNTFAEDMKQKAEFNERLLAQDAAQEASLHRECFITPFLADVAGRVIVERDGPTDKPSKLLIPRALRKDRTLLPTTGRVIKAVALYPDKLYADADCAIFGKRILFGQMSGTAICFKKYPTWILLEFSEILGIVEKSDVELEDETLEPMV